jgi:hypothetical protein
VEEVWSVPFEVEGQQFEAVFARRPFREGLEVQVAVGDDVLRFAEYGFGETALLEKVKTRVAAWLAERRSS